MRLVVIGDSVCWGQGLKEEHKFDFLLSQQLGLERNSLAHSGAIIGMLSRDTDDDAYGEVPIANPSVKYQWSKVAIDDDLGVVLLNGGLNDVDFRRLLNPFTTVQDVERLTQTHCGEQMYLLLRKIGRDLSGKKVRVIVVGYYPILSSDSTHFLHGAQLSQFVEVFGVSLDSTSAFRNDFQLDVPQFVTNCLTFWHTSDRELQGAVDRANVEFDGSPRFLFAQLPFNETNAVFGSQPLLWGLNPDLTAEDEVIELRGSWCERKFADLVHIPQLIQCYRASAGHPNLQGARAIAETLAKVMSQ